MDFNNFIVDNNQLRGIFTVPKRDRISPFRIFTLTDKSKRLMKTPRERVDRRHLEYCEDLPIHQLAVSSNFTLLVIPTFQLSAEKKKELFDNADSNVPIGRGSACIFLKSALFQLADIIELLTDTVPHPVFRKPVDELRRWLYSKILNTHYPQFGCI